MKVYLDKSFEDNLELAGTSEGQVAQAVNAISTQIGSKRGGVLNEDGEDVPDAAAAPAPVKRDLVALAKAAIVGAVAKLARPVAAGAILIATHQTFQQHLCDPTYASAAKTFSMVPLVGTYSDQCDASLKTYQQALMVATGIAAGILAPYIKSAAAAVEIPDDMVDQVVKEIGNRGKPRSTGSGSIRRKKTRKSSKKSKKSRRRTQGRRYH
jgi:hypothetical protein